MLAQPGKLKLNVSAAGLGTHVRTWLAIGRFSEPPAPVNRPGFACISQMPSLNPQFSPTTVIRRDEPSHASHLRRAADERDSLGVTSSSGYY